MKVYTKVPGLEEIRSQLRTKIQLLKSYSLLQDWKFQIQDIPGAEKVEFPDQNWQEVSLPYTWSSTVSECWFRKLIILPEKIENIPVERSRVELEYFFLTGTEIFVNGISNARYHYWSDNRAIQLILAEAASPGDHFLISVRTDRGDGVGAFISANLFISSIEKIIFELDVFLQQLNFVEALLKTSTRREELYELLSRAVSLFRGDLLEKNCWPEFIASLERALKPLLSLCGEAKMYSAHLVGHSHIDMNWLWPWPDTVEVCRRDFSTIDRLMEEFPQLCFSQSQAAVYLTTEEKFPDLFHSIQKRVREGRWEITAATWVEGDLNMASGESLVRQILYAKRYIFNKFKVEPRMCWEPDTFGHPWTYPQILKKSGLDFYYFCRAGKGLSLFWWEAPDGSRVLAFNREGYGGTVAAQGIVYGNIDFKQKYHLKTNMFVYGVGDHGGGPARKDILAALQLSKKPLLPDIKFSKVESFFREALSQHQQFPIVRDELNFVFEGCYTTHADIKRMNRESENLLITAETFSSLASFYGYPYLAKDFEYAWRNTCFNQFHDLLDGSAIHLSYQFSKNLFQETKELATKALNGALQYLASRINTDGEGEAVIVFNPLTWERTDVVSFKIKGRDLNSSYRLVDITGSPIPFQISGEEIIFVAENIPSLGYRVYHLLPFPETGKRDKILSSPITQVKAEAPATIENDYFQLRIHPQSGCILGLFDKLNQREVAILPEGRFSTEALESTGYMNLFQLYFEEPHSMSAWNIGNIRRIENLIRGAQIELLEKGPVRATIHVRHHYHNSVINQRISLYHRVPRIDFITTIDWHEKGSATTEIPMLKVSFTPALNLTRATFEIPFGFIERPAEGREVPALRWVDISQREYGVSLLNNCKYGHDVQGNTIRLTLVRSPYEPDANPDEGIHELIYSLYPHRRDWRAASTERRGYELNQPLLAVVESNHEGELPAECSFLTISPKNVVVSALKMLEPDGILAPLPPSKKAMILRFYESQGKSVVAKIRLNCDILAVEEADMMERPFRSISFSGKEIKMPLGKYEIKTLRIISSLPGT